MYFPTSLHNTRQSGVDMLYAPLTENGKGVHQPPSESPYKDSKFNRLLGLNTFCIDINLFRGGQ